MQADRKLHSLKQGTRSLQAYYDEFVELARRVHRNGNPNRLWSVDDLEVHVTRFILGLQPNLQEQYDKFRAYELAQGSMMCRSLPEIFNFLNSLEAVKARVQDRAAHDRRVG